MKGGGGVQWYMLYNLGQGRGLLFKEVPGISRPAKVTCFQRRWKEVAKFK